MTDKMHRRSEKVKKEGGLAADMTLRQFYMGLALTIMPDDSTTAFTPEDIAETVAEIADAIIERERAG